MASPLYKAGPWCRFEQPHAQSSTTTAFVCSAPPASLAGHIDRSRRPGPAGRAGLVPHQPSRRAGGWRIAAGWHRSRRAPGRRRTRRRVAEHGGRGARAPRRRAGAARFAGHGDPGGHRDRAPAGVGRAGAGVVHRRPDGHQGPVAGADRCAAIRAGADAGHRLAPARRGATAERPPHARALSHAAAAGFDRAARRRHAGSAGQATRRHGGHRSRQRGHGTPQSGLHAHRRAGGRPRRAAPGGCRQPGQHVRHHRRGGDHAAGADRCAVHHLARPRARGDAAPGHRCAAGAGL